MFICLVHPSECLTRKKNNKKQKHIHTHKLAPWRTLGKRWLGPYSEPRAGGRLGRAARPLMKQPATLCPPFSISGTSPSPRRSPARSRPPYSRVETHGRQLVPARLPYWGHGGRGEKKRRAAPASSSDGCAGGPTSPRASPLAGRGPRAGSQSDRALAFPFMCPDSHHSVAPVTSEGSPANRRAGSGTCIQEEEKARDTVAMATRHFLFIYFLKIL